MDTRLMFERNKKQQEGVLIAYFPLGTGKYDTVELAQAYIEGGVDILEIGIPVEHPFLDGKTIRDIMETARHTHADEAWYLNEIRRIREAFPEVVLEVFSYKEAFQGNSCECFLMAAAAAGADCALITDMTDEEYDRYFSSCPKPIIPMIKFLPFNAEESYIEDFQKKPYGGFVFLQAVNGQTGARDRLEPELAQKVARAKRLITMPVCAGFGISCPEHAAEITAMGADGIIIGSITVTYVMEHSKSELIAMLRSYKEALRVKE